ncbi:adhesion G protein-coupled receptor L3-like [Acanthaster planci]|uniref:Adhesion G protein-coupled receptor L3-like n=1 Tax=Acanthaster planci TaxID=133434 RepID=A0A8B7XH07_ACAPL|nr:adhesion G protein-coupled receptor L3-like [Acanthaster planci]XP_022079403.1 adhesion G protein-coupled receptor L3-like [Acanthaster planci]
MFLCTCVAGYEGTQCEIDTNECASSPCMNGGTCTDQVNGYSCYCPGYSGSQCQTDIDECASSPCREHGTCEDQIDAYACHCQPGYVGVHCETDIDECASGPCQQGSTCFDMEDGYQCVCPPGYDGVHCEIDINECSSRPCLNGASCHNGIDEYNCSCAAGYEGINCQSDIDECASSPCQNGAICVDAVNGYSCNCSLGYRGVHCQEDIDECAGNPCQHGSTCRDEVNQYRCACLPGYDGVHCQNDINECASNPCKHDGTCVDQVNEYKCNCKAGLIGLDCQTDADECSSDPCKNGATCKNLVNRFECHCADGYIGEYCEGEDIEALCAGGPDGIEGSGLVWDETKPGETNMKPCPEGTNGNASRWCDLKAKWSNPDLSQCVSPAFAEVSGKAELLKSGNASATDVLDLANTLQNLTQIPRLEEGTGDGKQIIYPGDMEVATKSLGLISEVAMGSVKGLDVSTAKDLTKACAGTINNVVDESQIYAWKNTNNPEKVASSVTTMITSVENMASVVRQKAEHLDSESDDSALMIKDKNLELEISVFQSNDTDLQEDFLDGAEDQQGEDGLPLSHINLPEDLLDAVNNQSIGYIGVMKAKFSSVGELYSLGSDRSEDQDIRKGYVNTDVLSLKVLGVGESHFQNLETPIRLVFKHTNEGVDAVQTSCVFLKTTKSAENLDGHDTWDVEGCKVESTNKTHTVCLCWHLTNFAILMDIHGSQANLPEGHNTALSVLSYIGGTLSILGCFFSIAIYQFFRLKSDRIRVHMHLAAAIAISQLIFLVGIERNEIAWVCKVIAVVLHYCLTAMFCWMLVEGIQLYLALVHVFGSSSHIKKYLLLGWGAPLVIVGISFGVFFKDYGSGNTCWLTQQMLLIVFVPTVGILIILNTVVLIIVLKVMMTSLTAKEKSKENDTSQIKTGLKAALVLLPLLGLTWVFGFMSVNEHTLVFTYLFAICNSLQGLFFFIAHCVMNIEVKKAYERRYGRKKGLHSLTTSSTAPVSSRSQASSRKHSDVSTTELIKRNPAVSTVSGGGFDNPVMKDTSLTKDPAKSKDNSMNNTSDTKKTTLDSVKVNDIQCLVKNNDKVNDEEKGLVEGAKVAMETIVSKDTNLKMDGSNIA